MLKMKPFFNKNPRDDSQIKETEFFITEGQYLDDNRIQKEYNMMLVTLECTSSTGKILRLSHPQYDYLTKHSELLTKAYLTNKLIEMSPPMSKMSQKTVK